MFKNDVVMDDEADGGPRPPEAVSDGGHNPDESVSPVDAGRLAAAIEAVLLTSDKPVAAARLAEGLGLAPRETGRPSDPAAPSGADQPGSGRSKRGRQRPQTGEESAIIIEGAVAQLNRAYEQTGRAFRVEVVAGGYRLMTLREFAPVLAAFHHSRTSGRLSRAAVETLAIIAYRQPITRAHLEAIRGVGCGEVLRSLMERRLVTIKGRAEELGRPMLYGTTKEFLDAFGLASLKDLPSASELRVG